MKEALYFKQEGEKVRCQLCPQYCLLKEGEYGHCQVRKVKNDKLIATSYGQVSACALDPIEKKPLFHFHPGSQILSIGTIGCNLKCKFCQNYKIAHELTGATQFLTPEQIVKIALEKDVVGLAYTYSEPFIWYEYILETAKLAYEYDLKNVLVTNGMINFNPLKEILPYINAVNLDIKSFSDQFYQKICEGNLKPVKRTAKLINQRQILLEITTLLIPELNTTQSEIKELVNWIANLNSSIPLHFSRYFPHYQLDHPPTSKETLLQALKVARQKLDYVYLGNISDPTYRTTYCPKCNEPVIKREFSNIKVNLDNKYCPKCETKIKLIK